MVGSGGGGEDKGSEAVCIYAHDITYIRSTNPTKMEMHPSTITGKPDQASMLNHSNASYTGFPLNCFGPSGGHWTYLVQKHKGYPSHGREMAKTIPRPRIVCHPTYMLFYLHHRVYPSFGTTPWHL